MPSKVYNFSNNYDYRTQRKCANCGIVYNLTIEYGSDIGDLGHYGCRSPREYIKGYTDKGCPYCKSKKRKEEEIQIAEYEKNLKKCPRCGKAEIYSPYAQNRYIVECDCVKTIKRVEFKNIPELIKIWNETH